MKKTISIILLWLISIAFAVIWTFDNLDVIEKVKSNFKKKIKPKYSLNIEGEQDSETIKIECNYLKKNG